MIKDVIFDGVVDWWLMIEDWKFKDVSDQRSGGQEGGGEMLGGMDYRLLEDQRARELEIWMRFEGVKVQEWWVKGKELGW